MLVRFHSPAYAHVTMFGDVALNMLKMMGMTGTIPGALSAQDVPAALAQLKHGLTALPPALKAKPDEEDDGPQVSLAKRAFPLIELLSAAANKQEYVMWEEER